MSVAEIDSLLYSAHHPVEALRRATRIPALSPGWQGSIKALLDAAERGDTAGNAGLSPASATPLAWRGFRPLKVAASRQESKEVRSFELATQDGSPLPGSLPGQYVIVKVRPAADNPPVARNYSLCGPPNAGTYRIAVKNEGGAASAFLHAHVRGVFGSGAVVMPHGRMPQLRKRPGRRPVALFAGAHRPASRRHGPDLLCVAGF
jgi:hypothetical protein